MNQEELQSTLEQVKAQVKAKPENKDKTEDEIDEIILDGFFKAYTDGKMSKEDLGGIAEVLGYEFTEEFEAEKEEPGKVEASEEDLQATMEPGESKEEFKEDLADLNADKDSKPADDDKDESNPAPEQEEVEEEEKEEDEEDEDGEREKASELWKMNLKR